LVVADLGALFGAQSDDALTETSRAEIDLTISAVLAQSLGVITVLASVQHFLSSTVLGCQSADQALSAFYSTGSYDEQTGGVSALVSPQPGGVLASEGNLTLLGRFDGSQPNDLDIKMVSRVQGHLNPGVSYFKTETHFVNLPVNLLAASSVCVAALSEALQSVNSTLTPGCIDSAIGQSVASGTRQSMVAATTSGLELQVHSTVVSRSPCVVSIVATVTQAEVEGPCGVFTVTMSEAQLEERS
jgi:hypothetical protein